MNRMESKRSKSALGPTTRMVGLALMMLVSVAVGAIASEDPSAARSVVDRYFDALGRGDTGALDELLTGRMKDRMARRMTNPNYSAFLQEQYGGTTLVVQETEELEGEGVQVTVEVSFPGSEPENFTLLLRRDENSDDTYRIFDEF